MDLGWAAWLCSEVNEALIKGKEGGKEGGFRIFCRGSSYRLILECSRKKGDSRGVCLSRLGEV